MVCLMVVCMSYWVHAIACPPNFCASVRCKNDITEESCTVKGKVFKPKGTFCGCCDACLRIIRKYLTAMHNLNYYDVEPCCYFTYSRLFKHPSDISFFSKEINLIFQYVLTAAGGPCLMLQGAPPTAECEIGTQCHNGTCQAQSC